MMKVLLAVLALIVTALIGGAYLGFNPTIPIFIILILGIFLVGRIARRKDIQLPQGTHVSWGAGHGVYLRGQDFVPPNPDDHSGGNLRDGVNPNDPANAR
jgi:hypothetical protein